MAYNFKTDTHNCCPGCGWPITSCICIQKGVRSSAIPFEGGCIHQWGYPCLACSAPHRPCDRCGRVDGTHGPACNETTKYFEREPALSKELIEDGRGVRTFETGANRDTDEGKYDYEGFLHPRVLETFAAYMHAHRLQADGSLRDSDNWQKGIPIEAYLKSLVRHVVDLWALEREHVTKQVTKDFPSESSIAKTKTALACAILFNVQGYLLETLRKG